MDGRSSHATSVNLTFDVYGQSQGSITSGQINEAVLQQLGEEDDAEDIRRMARDSVTQRQTTKDKRGDHHASVNVPTVLQARQCAETGCKKDGLYSCTQKFGKSGCPIAPIPHFPN